MIHRRFGVSFTTGVLPPRETDHHSFDTSLLTAFFVAYPKSAETPRHVFVTPGAGEEIGTPQGSRLASVSP